MNVNGDCALMLSSALSKVTFFNSRFSRMSSFCDFAKDWTDERVSIIMEQMRQQLLCRILFLFITLELW